MNKTIAEEGICAQTYPDLFFPETGEHDKTREAKRICMGCPVRRPCLAEALAEEGTAAASHRYGVRGGCSPRDRARIAKQRREAAAAGESAPLRVELPPHPRDPAVVLGGRSVDVGGGHLEWRGSSPVTVHGGAYTPRQLAWFVTHGERPVGWLQQLCEYKGCISPEHMRDKGTPPSDAAAA